MSILIDKPFPIFRSKGSFVRPVSAVQQFAKALEKTTLLLNSSAIGAEDAKQMVSETLQTVCENNPGYRSIVTRNLEGMTKKTEIQKYVYNIILSANGLKACY